MYLTYAEYQSYGGTLDETTFTDYEFEAQVWIDWYTFGRLQNDETVGERVKRCDYKLIQLAKMKADMLTLGSQTVSTTDASGHTTTVETSSAISHQANDGVSISYNVISADEAFRLLSGSGNGSQNLIAETCYKYLDGVKNSLGQRVLYRGIYPNE